MEIRDLTGRTRAWTIAVGSDNRVTVSGNSYRNNGTSETDDIATLRYLSTGPNPDPFWAAAYDGPAHHHDYATSIAVATDGSGNSVVVGFGRNSSNNDDIYVLKYNSSGARLWPPDDYTGHFDSGGNDRPRAVAIDSDGDVIVVGFRTTGTPQQKDWYIAKRDGSTGELLWQGFYVGQGGGDDEPASVALDASNHIYVTGYETNLNNNLDIVTIKYDSAGEGGNAKILWGPKTYDGGGNDIGVSVAIDPLDGYVVVAGSTLTSPGNNDFLIIRYSPTLGLKQWTRPLLRDATDDTAVAMGLDRSGNICVGGNTAGSNGTKAMSMKFNYTGEIIGATIYNKDATGTLDYVSAAAVNTLGEAFIAGYTMNGGNNDYLVFKCAWDTLTVPTPFTATPCYRTVDFQWADNATTEDGYSLERKNGACSPDNTNEWTILPAADRDATSYTDTNLTEGATYCYRIAAIKTHNGLPSGTVKDASRWIEQTVTLAVAPAPTNVIGTALNTTSIRLSWDDTAACETGFRVQRCKDPNLVTACTFTSGQDSFAEYPVGPGMEQLDDSNLCSDESGGQEYRYRVRAEGAGWESAWTYATASTQALSKPTLNATRINEAQISLSWSDVPDETGYDVLRCDDTASPGCIPVAEIKTGITGTTIYTDTTGLLHTTRYGYRVRAYKNSAGCDGGRWTADSVTSYATTTIIPPADLTARADNTTTVKLSWTDTSGSETGYLVSRCSGISCTPAESDSIVSPANPTTMNAVSYTDDPVCTGSAYRYRVRPMNEGLSRSGGGFWAKRALISITANFQSDYPVKLTITKRTGMRSDFSDLRFHDPAANRELPYWIESAVSDASAVVWVKPGANSSFYMYYDNSDPDLQSSSDGNAVFAFFDDFSGTSIDSNKWTTGTIATTSGTSFSQSGGMLIGGNTSTRATRRPFSAAREATFVPAPLPMTMRSNCSIISKRVLGAECFIDFLSAFSRSFPSPPSKADFP